MNNNMPIVPPSPEWATAMPSRVRPFLNAEAIKKNWPLVGIILFTAILLWWVYHYSQNDWRVIAADAQENQKQQILAALEKEGISTSLDNGSGAIKVPAASYQQAKIILASAGLSHQNPESYEALKHIEMGTSRAVENVRLRQALEAELEKSIAEISLVDSARVLIAVPETSPFIEDQLPITASVMVRLRPGHILSEEQVRSILNIVASAVPGLTIDHVSIADQSGNLLSDSQSDPAFAAAHKKLQYKKKIEDQIIKRINDILLPLAGAGNYTIAVNADLDFDEKEMTREKVDPQTALRVERNAKNTDNSQEANGIPGATSNVPTPAAQINEQAQNNAGNMVQNISENSDKGYEVGREISNVKSEIGSIRRLTIAVALRSGKLFGKAKDINMINALIKSASGYDPARNDVLTVEVKKFAPVQAVPDMNFIEKYEVIDRSPYWMGALLAIALALYLLRMAKSLIQQIGQKETVIAPLQGHLSQSIPTLSAPRDYEEKIKVIRDFATQETDRATAVMRQLLTAPEQNNG